MEEIVFRVHEDPSGGFVAEAEGVPIVTQAEDLDSLLAMACDAVRCHFADESPACPNRVRLCYGAVSLVRQVDFAE